MGEETKEETLVRDIRESIDREKPSLEEKPEMLPPILPEEEPVGDGISFKQQVEGRTSQREHIRLQEFVRKAAQDYGFRVVLEEPTENPVGRVDVAIHTPTLRVACEISVTTPPPYELGNIQKCLANGYDVVVMCSENLSHLSRIQELCENELPERYEKQVVFGNTEDVVQLLHRLSQKDARGDSMKGYKVKVWNRPSNKKGKDVFRNLLDDLKDSKNRE